MVRRTKEEAQETRSQILEAAEKAFYERGVARTTLADIASLAGVTRGAIYWHFSNKADLVQAMLDTLHEPLDEMAKASESEDELDPLGCMRFCFISANSPMKCATCASSAERSASTAMCESAWPCVMR
jgi:TetR/AcrR family acrAB operon transcriptional repressor